MKPFNYVLIIALVLMLICSAVAMFFIGGFTAKTISLIVAVIAASLITNSIHQNFLIKKTEKDERNIDIENKAKAKAFDIMGIILGVLVVIYALLKCYLIIILLAAGAYLLIYIVYMLYFSKYHKEM